MGVTDNDIMEGLLIEGLQDWISLSNVHSSFMPEQPDARPPLHEVQQRTLNMIRELVGEGLFVLGMPAGRKTTRTSYRGICRSTRRWPRSKTPTSRTSTTGSAGKPRSG
jgi:hypothetical protein